MKKLAEYESTTQLAREKNGKILELVKKNEHKD